MTTEEKARAYDKALEKAQEGKPVEEIFPELKKSKDKIMSEAAIQLINGCGYLYAIIDGLNIDKNDVITWLEKQGEQKTVFIPKFRVGDVVMFDGYRDKSTITEIDFDNKWYSIAEDKTRCILFSEQDNWKLVEQRPTMIKWTGDNLREVLDFTGKTPQFDKWFNSFDEYETYVHSHNNIFKMFNEDGSHYEVPVGAWIVKTPDGHNVASKSTYVQKPAEWGEEDEKMRTKCAACLGFHYHYGLMTRKEYNEAHNWLNSLKDRVLPHSKQDSINFLN